MAEKQKIDLNQIPLDWITIDPKGEIIIKDKKFSEQVKGSIDEGLRTGVVKGQNGNCNC